QTFCLRRYRWPRPKAGRLLQLVRISCCANNSCHLHVESDMKKFVVSLLAASVLAACRKTETPETPTPAASPAEAAATPERPRPVPAPEDEQGIDILEVAGVKFDFPHQVHYDILDTSRRGTRRHRVLVEIRGGDFNE